MRRIVISPSATRDLAETWHYIAEDSVDAADRVLERIRSELTRVAEMPGIGHRHQHIRDPQIRVWRVYSYLICYRFTGDAIEVARIVSGRRDLRKLFPRK